MGGYCPRGGGGNCPGGNCPRPWYYIHIQPQVNQNFSTSTFLFIWYLDEL
jgi:hypothetical protein